MTNRSPGTQESRLHFLDNLRTLIIFLVVVYHAGGVYESTGIWASFWIVDDPATTTLPGILNLVLDIFVMSTLFLVSGYWVPASVAHKSGWGFLRSRFRRLMVPWLIAVFTLIPLYKVVFLYSRHLPQEHWTAYFHVSSNSVTGQSWLWFLPVLFVFNVLYLLFSRARLGIPGMSLRSAVAGTFLVGWIYSSGMDLLGLRGWTLTPLLDFQRERILIYWLYFLLGVLCFRLRVFDQPPASRKLYKIVNGVSWIPITVYLVFLIVPVVSPGTVIVSRVVDRVVVWFCFHASLLSLVYLMIESFRRYLDRPGRIWTELSANSYYVYIIHVVVIGGIAAAMLSLPVPALLKYLVLTVSAYAASNLIVSVSRRAFGRIQG